MIGLMIDLHGTLLESNFAWATALESIDPKRYRFYREQIQSKRNRHELAQIAGVSFDYLLKTYRKNLIPRQEVVELLETLSVRYPAVIVSNAERERILKDLEYVPALSFSKIYTSEDGRKPDSDYLQRILEDQKWERAFLIGNDPKEDISLNENVFSIILPQRKLIL